MRGAIVLPCGGKMGEQDTKAILCVDDEAIILLSIREELRAYFGEAYRYEIATNPDRALKLIEELSSKGVQIVLIVTDWLMPHMKGDEFLIVVKARYPQIRSIMITGQADQASIERAKREAGLFACIPKPWKPGELVRAIETCVEGGGA
jgi:CheY-like chemotaxis protein